ncbi:uncharacterized protein CTRU02_201026 [Colletotrichum truncatum]|uniref:Uncharacterized protein n=1 Tax=Colletotrichum truncatum TaxID=5467 RepID=A0ACC3ZGK9_COLTU|nr:uncharacterized protein CTRU02_12338 [Colletotrichum truncatum]KAF6784633.1 hypothetical protein CTRU02_12338 [Colletotrichum truncatum]
MAMSRRQVMFSSPDTTRTQIYREEGVFTERYDKERCMNRLEEHKEQINREVKERQERHFQRLYGDI